MSITCDNFAYIKWINLIPFSIFDCCTYWTIGIWSKLNRPPISSIIEKIRPCDWIGNDKSTPIDSNGNTTAFTNLENVDDLSLKIFHIKSLNECYCRYISRFRLFFLNNSLELYSWTFISMISFAHNEFENKQIANNKIVTYKVFKF